MVTKEPAGQRSRIGSILGASHETRFCRILQGTAPGEIQA